MKKRFMKLMTVCIMLTLFTSMLAACGGSSGAGSEGAKEADAGTATTADGKPDTSKKVTLNWYLLGDAHADTPKVVEEWNKMLEKDLNTTVKLNFTTWNDWQTKYNLLLASGEKVDMVFASSWADFFKYSKQGAFLPLNDLLPTYAPETWKEVPEQDWKDVTVSGKIYAVPSTYPEYTPDGIVYREDWRQELNVPEITDLDSIEKYMDAVKTVKNVTPIKGKAWNEVNTLFHAYYDFKNIGGDSGVIVAKSYDTPRDVVAYPFTTEFEEWVKRMKTWADKGFWTSNTLSVQQEAGDFIKTGTGAVYWRNAPGAAGFITDIEKNHKDIKMGYFPFTRFHNYAVPNLGINNGMAIPKNASNPERSLMVLEKLRNDPAYYNLMTYGIEGRNYKFDDKGAIISPAPGQDPAKVTSYSIASWGWRYSKNDHPAANRWAGEDKLNEEFKAETKPDIFSPILMDYQPVKSQLAAVNQVYQQFGMPLMMGLVPDVDKALENYRSKLKAAGVDDVLKYVQEQVNAYADEKGLK
ncbi:putative aldouronate transport system substrate-binding protein [Paenibacillus rhizosphaerae]|uniref:Putative aldouronate transport system substrate-binding protein n=1 Tax=Paenibacillus rhizosphaerae TaxID=297318 RepID=A0A839TX54_9BACL|nr:extracellular solute-binding protein [Paenibacillus rhizosphaerae]MBB3130170.1 putative aldouronate transport system substrate-binding protein [Paenibacillus rhizosphaerae]